MLRFCTVLLAMLCCSAAPVWREKRGNVVQEKIALVGFKGGLIVLKDVLNSVGSACYITWKVQVHENAMHFSLQYIPSKVVQNQLLGQTVYNVCILLDAVRDFELLSELTDNNDSSATVIATTARAVRIDGCTWVRRHVYTINVNFVF